MAEEESIIGGRGVWPDTSNIQRLAKAKRAKQLRNKAQALSKSSAMNKSSSLVNKSTRQWLANPSYKTSIFTTGKNRAVKGSYSKPDEPFFKRN